MSALDLGHRDDALDPAPPPWAVPATYRGQRGADGRQLVVVQDTNGLVIRVLQTHGPAGYSWGTAGPGAEALTKDLLVDALGTAARCPACTGAAWLIEDEYQARAYRPLTDRDICPDLVRPCTWCDGGVIPLPVHAFVWQYASQWGPHWMISRAEIRHWHRAVTTIGGPR